MDSKVRDIKSNTSFVLVVICKVVKKMFTSHIPYVDAREMIAYYTASNFWHSFILAHL